MMLFLSPFFLSFLLPLLSQAARYTPVVPTTTGKVVGYVENFRGNELYHFLGIPYAVPPLGKLRFLKPVAIPPWDGVKTVVNKPPSCVQHNNPILQREPREMSEDCLFLNVITPEQAVRDVLTMKKRAVVVEFHPGSFRVGSGADEPFLSRPLVALHDVVLVTLNYRLDVFGFIYHSKIPGFVGNLGLWDQNLALEWVKNNIARFGGDPNRVTILGQSAGSKSVFYQISSPHSTGLFQNAIMQSGVGLYIYNPANERVQTSTDQLLQATHCDQAPNKLTCLQALSATEIINLKSSEEYAFSPIYKDEFLPQTPKEFLANPYLTNDVNVMFGTMEDDGSIFFARISPLALVPVGLTYSKAQKVIATYFYPSAVENISQIYLDGDPYGKPRTSGYRGRLIDMYTDFAFACPAYEFGRRYSAIQKKGNTYSIYTTYKPKAKEGTICMGISYLGVCHLDDVPMTFGVPITESIPDSEDVIDSLNMLDIVATFAKTGRPPNQGSTEWPNWRRPQGQQSMIINPEHIGQLEYRRVEYCRRMWNYFSQNLIPKTHVYRSF